MHLLADDSVIYREVNSQRDHLALEQDLEYLCKQADLWQLSFNITKFYHLGTNNETVPICHDYLLNGQAISRVTSTRY